MNVKVNGQPAQLADGTTVRQLIEQHRLKPQNVAVELNRRLLKTEHYDRVLQENDEVEIVTFVGGG